MEVEKDGPGRRDQTPPPHPQPTLEREHKRYFGTRRVAERIGKCVHLGKTNFTPRTVFRRLRTRRNRDESKTPDASGGRQGLRRRMSSWCALDQPSVKSQWQNVSLIARFCCALLCPLPLCLRPPLHRRKHIHTIIYKRLLQRARTVENAYVYIAL